MVTGKTKQELIVDWDYVQIQLQEVFIKKLINKLIKKSIEKFIRALIGNLPRTQIGFELKKRAVEINIYEY